MNKVLLIGRVTSDVRIFQTQSGVRYARVRLAINRRGTTDISDFIPLVAWRSNADFMASNVYKGTLIAVEGSITTSSYQRDGATISNIEVTIDNINILEPKSVVQARVNGNPNAAQQNRFVADMPSRDFGERVSSVPNQQVHRYNSSSNQSLYNNPNNHAFAGFTVDESHDDNVMLNKEVQSPKLSFTPTNKFNEMRFSDEHTENIKKDFLSDLDEDNESIAYNDLFESPNNQKESKIFDLDTDDDFDDIINPNHDLDFDK